MSERVNPSAKPNQPGKQTIAPTPLAVVGMAVCNPALSLASNSLGEYWHHLLWRSTDRPQKPENPVAIPGTSSSPVWQRITSLQDLELPELESEYRRDLEQQIRAALLDTGYVQADRVNLDLDLDILLMLRVSVEVLDTLSDSNHGTPSGSPLADLVQAQELLQQGQWDWVIVGAVEGIGPELRSAMVVLKRLRDAEQTHDRIYAVIPGGQGTSGATSVTELLHWVHDTHQIPPQTLSLLQIQGKLVQSENPLQDGALQKLFGPRQDLFPHCAIDLSDAIDLPDEIDLPASHANAGNPVESLQALIKVILGLQQKILPPTLYPFDPEFLCEATHPFYANSQARPWLRDRGGYPNRAGIAAGGEFPVYLILEEYGTPSGNSPLFQPFENPRAGARLDPQWSSELLVFRAESPGALIVQLQQLQQQLQQQLTESDESNPSLTLAGIAATLAAHPSPSSSHRLAIVANDLRDLDKKLAKALKKLAAEPDTFRLRTGIYYGVTDGSKPHQVACLFPGQGAQYPNMLLDLFLYFPQLQQWFNDLNQLYTPTDGSLPSAFVFPPPTGLAPEAQTQAKALLYSVVGGAQATLLINLALFELLQTFKVPCHVMLGHSNGENSALIASGHWQFDSRRELLQLIRETTLITPKRDAAIPIPSGVNLAVNGFSPDLLATVLAEFGGQVHWAMDNCPQQVVLFGEPEVMKRAAERFTEAGCICTPLPFDRAYHTPLYEVRSQALADQYRPFKYGSSHTSLYSCATTEPFPQDPDAIRATAIYQWTHRVQFRQTIEKLYQRGVNTFIEVGPGNVLTAFVDDVLREHSHVAIPMNLKQRSGLAQLQLLLGQLYVQGIPLDLSPLFRSRGLVAEPTPSPPQSVSPPSPKPSPVIPASVTASPVTTAATAEALDGDAGASHPISPMEYPPTNQPLNRAANDIPNNINIPDHNIPDNGASRHEHSATPIPGPIYDSIQADAAPGLTLGTVLGNVASQVPDHNPLDHNPVHNPAIGAPLDVPLAPSADPSADFGLSVLQGHFQLMQTFLTHQEQVATTVFAHLQAPSQDSNPENLTLPHSFPSLTTDTPFPQETNPWPLLGPILEQSPERLYCERRFDLERDRFLHDHTLGSAQYLSHAGLLPLAVVPFTVSMEIVAQAAACLVGGTQVVVGLSQLRSSRWLALDREYLDLGILAQRQPNPSANTGSNSNTGSNTVDVMVQVFELTDSIDAPRRLVFSGKAHLADTFPTPGDVSPPLALQDAAPPKLAVQTFYDHYLFHGPCFKSIHQVHQWNQNQINATFQVPSSQTFFRDLDNPQFQVPGNWLDSVGQLVAFWFMEHQHQDFGLFPFGIQTFEQYQAPSPTGAYLIVESSITNQGNNIYTADFRVWDHQQRPIVRIQGWQMRYYVSRLIPWILRPHPLDSYLSSDWLPQAQLAQVPDLVCRRLEVAQLDVFEENWGIWKRSLAHLLLTRREREIWYGFGERSPRRGEWLLGRIVAKETARQWLQHHYGLNLAAVDLEILATESGQPFISLCNPSPSHFTQGSISLPTLSITHYPGVAIAAVSTSPGLGIDGESLPPRISPEGLESAFSPEERMNLPSPDTTTLLALWCAKEAAAKAAGTGFKGDPQQWVVHQWIGQQWAGKTVEQGPTPESGSAEVIIQHHDLRFQVKLWYLEQEVFALCHG
jgi:acyl transferase domain-containing protein/phosphopantetheinyl transferase